MSVPDAAIAAAAPPPVPYIVPAAEVEALREALSSYGGCAGGAGEVVDAARAVLDGATEVEDR